LSGAILYLAIVAIWAVVLVPRWLRPRPVPPQPVPVPAEEANAGRWDLPDPGQDGAAAWTTSARGPGTESEQEPGEDAGDAPEDEPQEAAPSSVSRRPDMVKARRRLLTTLVTLTVIAVALAVIRVDAYWIIIPPAALLSGYLLLLRHVTQFDAERARRTARIRHDAQVQAAQEPSTSQVPVAGAPDHESVPDQPAAPGSAEIIDISGRIGDQVYDQYSDAANRAVGD
jgi:hypothetical protein